MPDKAPGGVIRTLNGTAHFWYFSLVIEGTTEKVLQLILPVKLIYNQNLGFTEQKNFFLYYREIQTIKNICLILFLS
jgi:hypothetical protein